MLTLLVSSFLRVCPNCPSAGHFFAEILRYYGEVFDPRQMFIDRGDIIILQPTEMNLGTEVLVLDPFRTGVNAASTLTRFSEIKALFSRTHSKLVSLVNSGSEDRKGESILGAIYQAD